MITQTFDLNLIPESSPVIVHVNQYDVGAGRLIAKLYNGDVAYTPATGATVVIQGTKPDGHGFMYNATWSGNTVTANLTDQMTPVCGVVRTQIVVTEGNNITGTFVFTLNVQKSSLPADADMSDSEYQAIEELIRAAIAASSNPPIIGQNGHWWIIDAQTGEYVDSGVDASITVRIADITMLPPDTTPYVTNTGTDTDPIFHLFIPRGKGISSISKTSTSGLQDTYTITYSDGATYNYVVTNGSGIASIAKTGTSGLVDTYTITFDNGNTTTYTITNGKTAYQSAVEGGYSKSEAQFESDLANFETWANTASTKAGEASQSASTASTKAGEAAASATSANTNAEKAEAYAVGQINGQDVPSSHTNYHNNAKYYSDNADASATASETSKLNSEAYAIGKRNGTDVDSSDPAYQNNSRYYAGQAASSATAASSSAGSAARSATSASSSSTNASNSATAAAGSASDANNYAGDAYESANDASDYAGLSKSYAVGTNGVTRAGDATDNSKYYSEQAAGAVASANAVLDDVVDAGNDALTAIQNALDNDAPEFEINFTTGHLMYGGTRFVFQIDDTTGHLMWGLAV